MTLLADGAASPHPATRPRRSPATGAACAGARGPPRSWMAAVVGREKRHALRPPRGHGRAAERHRRRSTAGVGVAESKADFLVRESLGFDEASFLRMPKQTPSKDSRPGVAGAGPEASTESVSQFIVHAV